MLTDAQKKELNRDLPADHVRSREAGRGRVDYLPAWRVFDEANRILGNDGWSYELVGEVRQVYEGRKKSRDGGENLVLLFEATVRVTVGTCTKIDVGLDTCDVPDRADAVCQGIDKARKGAVSDGVKRALRSLGRVLGLALYDKDQSFVGSSLTCQRLLEELEGAEDLDAWVSRAAPRVQELSPEEQREVHDAVVSRRRAAKRPALAPEPEPQPAAPACDALALYRDRLSTCVLQEELVAVRLARRPELSRLPEDARAAAAQATLERAAALGLDQEALQNAVGQARSASEDPQAWGAMAALLHDLGTARSEAEVGGAVRAHGQAAMKLPPALVALANRASKARRAQLSPAPEQGVAA